MSQPIHQCDHCERRTREGCGLELQEGVYNCRQCLLADDAPWELVDQFAELMAGCPTCE